MSKSLFAASMLLGALVCAGAEVFDYPDCRIHALRDAANRFPAQLFASVDPNESFVQTERDYAGSVNVFVVEYKADRRRVMIDAGFGAPRGKLLAEMKKAGIAPESITDILVTHIHPDHVGGLPDFPKAKVHIAKCEYEAWANDPARRSLARYLPEAKDLDLFAYDAEIFPNLVALKVPGHTPGHTVFRMGARYFIGDLVHAARLQIAHPAFCARYDMDPQQAAAGRRRALKEFRGEWYGAHIPFPGRYRNQPPARNI